MAIQWPGFSFPLFAGCIHAIFTRFYWRLLRAHIQWPRSAPGGMLCFYNTLSNSFQYEGLT